jgi:hypothetical protein
VVVRQRNRRKRVSNDDSMLGKPKKKRNKVLNNTYTLSRDVCTFNIRYDVVRLFLVQRAGSDVGDIGNSNVISKRGKEARDSFRGYPDKTRQDKTRHDSKLFQSRNLLCYTRQRVKREEKEILQRPQHSLYIQFVCHPRTIPYAPMYHPNLIP